MRSVTPAFLLLLFTLCQWAESVAADTPNKQLRYVYSPDGDRLVMVGRDDTEQIRSLRSQEVSDPVLVTDTYLDTILDENRSMVGGGLSALDFSPNLVQDLASGKTKVWYQQSFESIPVHGGTVSVTLDSEGQFVSAYTNIINHLSVSTIPALNKRRAVKKARKFIYRSGIWKNARVLTRRQSRRTCRRIRIEGRADYFGCVRKNSRLTLRDYRPRLFSAPELVVYSPSVLLGMRDNDVFLAWKFRVSLFEDRQVQSFLIDAHSGNVLDGGPTESFQQPERFIYDCSWENVDNCTVDQNFGGHTYGRSEGMPPNGVNPRFGLDDVDLAYDLSLDIHNAYIDFLGRDGANDRGGMGDGLGIPLTYMRIFTYLNNYGPLSYICDGYESNASGGYASIAFCAGSVLPEIFAHEYAHVSTYYLRFDMQNEPQVLMPDSNHYGETHALNEAFADFFGEYIHYKLDGTLDWIVGSGTSSTYRDFSDPKSVLNVAPDFDTFPISYTDSDFYCGQYQSVYAHTNHSIFNKANYLLSVGGSHNGCEIEGIGIDKVARIWMYALENYFLPDHAEKYYEAYLHLQAACTDLAEAPDSDILPTDCEQVTSALQSVHLDKPGGCVCAEFDGQECLSWEHHENVGTTEPASCVEEDLEVLGDFNGDSIVDKSDWSIWFSSKGDEGEGLPADADLSGRVGVEDCEIWKGNFGAGTCLEDDSEGCVEPEYFRGDYDLDGDNDVDDYQVWRSSFGLTDQNHPADGNKDGSVDLADYTVWRDSLGAGSCSE